MANVLAPNAISIDPETLNYLAMLRDKATNPTNYLAPAADTARVGAGGYGLPYIPPLASQDGGPELRAYEPSLEDRARYGLLEAGVPQEQAGRAAAVVPYTGPGLGYEAGQKAKRGDVTGAATNLTLALAPGAPGKAVSKAVEVARTFPKTAGLAAALASMFGASGQAGEVSDPEKVKDLQRTLRDAGFYSGKIDGVMGDVTNQANAAYQKDQAQKQQAELEGKKTEAALAASKAAADTAAAAKAETERKKTEAERKASEREAGAERLKQVEDSESSVSKAVRDWGPMLAMIVGGGIGGGFRSYATRTFGAASQKAAREANRYVTSKGNVAERAAGVNRFWQEGGAETVPFKPTPSAKYAISSNRKAPDATELFPQAHPVSGYVKARDALTMGTGGIDVGFSTYMYNQARSELTDAQKAVSDDPSEANIQRFTRAQRETAMWEDLQRAGYGLMGGYLGAGTKIKYQATRPNVAKAGSERMLIDQVIANAKAKKKSAGK